MIRATIWNEFRHEKSDPQIKKLYPRGMHAAIAEYLKAQTDFKVKTATLDEEEHGLTEKVLASTDVLVWWGHMAHGEVQAAFKEKSDPSLMMMVPIFILTLAILLLGIFPGYMIETFTKLANSLL